MYTIIIDESGDVGLTNVQADPSNGPTQYFALCAVMFNEDNREKIETALDALPFNRGLLHANKLNHFEKVHFCRQIGTLPVGLLGVLSNKLSLLGYLNEAKRTPTHYYNKVMQYLMERIGDSLRAMRIPAADVRILIEAREQRYDSLLFFLKSIQQTPLHPNAAHLRNIDIFSISRVGKADDKCVALADMGAHAIFSAVRRDSKMFGLAEGRYLHEIRKVFLASKDGKIVPRALKPIHSVDDLALPDDERDSLNSLTNPISEYRRL